jgi:hypothetical protein
MRTDPDTLAAGEIWLIMKISEFRSMYDCVYSLILDFPTYGDSDLSWHVRAKLHRCLVQPSTKFEEIRYQLLKNPSQESFTAQFNDRDPEESLL